MANTAHQKDNSEYIIVGIDGTSSREWMKPDGSNSHTNKFLRDFKGSTTTGINKQWYHGTSDVVLDRESATIIQQALNFITTCLRRKFPEKSLNRMRPLEMFDVNTCKQSEYYNQMQHGQSYAFGTSELKIPVRVAHAAKHQSLTTNDIKIILIGHSRGCMATTILAKMLSPIVKVYFMGLYDSVDKNICFDSTLIENVQYVYHAIRNNEVRSRGIFGHSSITHSSDVVYVQKSFYTSHGGIGGDYVKDPKKASAFGDSSCIPQPEQIKIYSSDGDYRIVNNIHPLTKRFGKPINEICEDGRTSADAFIRNGARERGLPLG